MIMMATFDEFEAKTIRAFDLQPQEGRYAFLPGKGWGTEIAIQYPVYKKTDEGYIERRKDPVCFQARGYRSHSDFEMYGMQRNSDPLGCYTPEFYEEFGAQEHFETTKMHEDVSREELWDNTEITILPNGRKIITLSVEYLLVEKLIDNPEFEEPDNHGRNISDAGALALVYEDIDREKVKKIYTKNRINHFVKRLSAQKDKSDEEYLGAKSVEEFIMAPRGRIGISRYDKMIKMMEHKNWKIDDLWLFAQHYNVGLLKQSDYAPLLAIHNDPQNWENGKLTEKAKKAIKKAMIESTQKSLGTRRQDIQRQIDSVKKSIDKIDLFFDAVDQRKEELKQDKKIKKNKPRDASHSSKKLREILAESTDREQKRDNNVAPRLRRIRQVNE